MAPSSLTPRPGLLSLCSGTAMLDIGVKLAFEHVFGVLPRVLGYAEREAYAAALLLARMEEQSLEPAPVFCADFRDLDARPLRGHVGLFAAGLPCQPYSAAGKQKGLRDERSYGKGGDGPLPHAIRILSECAPALVCLENVPQWVTSGAFRRFGDSLAALGYEIEDPLFVRASDVGASHRRERVFILAHLPGQRRLLRLPAGPGPEGQGMADAGGTGWQSGSELGSLSGEADGAALGDSTSEFRGPFFAPGPDAFEAWAHTLRNAPHLAPALESGVCVLADGVAFPLDASRPDQLRCAGNGVVALQAAAAFAHLFRRLSLS